MSDSDIYLKVECSAVPGEEWKISFKTLRHRLRGIYGLTLGVVDRIRKLNVGETESFDVVTGIDAANVTVTRLLFSHSFNGPMSLVAAVTEAKVTGRSFKRMKSTADPIYGVYALDCAGRVCHYAGDTLGVCIDLEWKLEDLTATDWYTLDRSPAWSELPNMWKVK